MRRSLASDLNFASRDHALSSRLVAALTGVCALLLLTVVLMGGEVVAARAARAALDLQRTELEARTKKLLPVMEERDRLLKDLAAMAELIEVRRFSWTRFLTETEKVFPEGAALDELAYDPKERALQLKGTARSPEALRNLMAALERSAAFQDPQLRQQSIDKGTISFLVGARYR